MSFVTVDIATDASSLLDDSLTQINSTLAANGFPGWTAEDADLAVIILSTVAQIAADNATIAATVLDAAFRTFGTQLMGIPYNAGTAASVVSTWTFTSAAPTGGYAITAGTAVTVDSQAFYVSQDVVTATGDLSASVPLVASDVGTVFNGLGGIGNAVQPSDEIDWVASITLTAATSGGVDQETDSDYQDRLRRVLQLIAPRPIIAPDFASMLLSDYCANATGIVVGRATSFDGYYPAARTLSIGGTGPPALTCVATIASGSTSVPITSLPYPFAVPAAGAAVTGTGIPSNTTVAGTPTSSSFTLSNAATASGSETVTVGAWTNVERCTTSVVTKSDGTAYTNTEMDALQAWLAGYREANFLPFVEPPSYTTIYVTATVHPLPDYVGSAVAAAAQAALLGALNPANWGIPAGGQASTPGSSWLNTSAGFGVIHRNVLIGIVQNVPGVQYVATLALNVSSSPTSTADITLTGPAPLPQSTSSTILVSSV